MPIYEYTCKACGHEFEALVRGNAAPKCAACGATDLDRKFPMPSVSSEATRAQAMRAAQQRDKKLGNERAQEQLRYERSHND